jgi:acetylornithine deacetylase/succinyl-diaminopimelate desuccinylase-like protein
MENALKPALAEQANGFRTLIKDYCQLESVAAQNRMMGETAEWVENLLKDTGFETHQLEVDGAPNYVYGEIKGQSDFILLFYNHYDVQPEDPVDLWKSPPFEMTERDGKLFARGISDNKAELISRVCAIKALLSTIGELPITIKWIIEGEEEIGSPHFDTMTKTFGSLLTSDGALWEGGGFTEQGQGHLTLGFRGLLYIELTVKKLKQDAHSGLASFFPSAAWRLVKALSCLRNDEGKVLIPGFYEDVLEPTEAQKEALLKLVNPDMEENIRKIYGIKAFNDNASGYELEKKVFEPTANIAGFLAGYTKEGAKTILPAEAMAKMDFRLVPDQNPDDILDNLRTYLKEKGFEDVTIKMYESAEAIVTPVNNPFVQKVARICANFTDMENKIDPMAYGSLSLLEAFKKNVNILGLSTVGNPVYYGSLAHAPNEHIRIKDIAKAIEFNTCLLEGLGK